ncbi:DUF4166 domain-containing protein [Bacillus velezensis]|uniref:DUF4166 domain-containing protein n=1 Tax=Bacillus velezensis TaxID=492670 RepID=UPI003BB09602
MTDSMYEKTITHYQSLHPMLQKRYRFDGSRTFCGEGVMSEIKGGSFLVRMLLKTGVFFQRGETISLLLSKTKTGKMAWNGIVPFSLKAKRVFLMRSWNMMSGKTEFLITSANLTSYCLNCI